MYLWVCIWKRAEKRRRNVDDRSALKAELSNTDTISGFTLENLIKNATFEWNVPGHKP